MDAPSKSTNVGCMGAATAGADAAAHNIVVAAGGAGRVAGAIEGDAGARKLAPLLVTMTEVATPAQRVEYRAYIDAWITALKRAIEGGTLPDADAGYARMAAAFSGVDGSIPSLIADGCSVAEACRTAALLAAQPPECGLAQHMAQARQRFAAHARGESAAEAGARLLAFMLDPEGTSAAVLRRAFFAHAEALIGEVEPCERGDAYPWVTRGRHSV